MVEVWPYAERSSGIAWFQLFGRLAGFFTTFVNPIGLDGAGWKYLISYCCWLAYEVVFVYFMFPETFGRTLEELAFSTSHYLFISRSCRTELTDSSVRGQEAGRRSRRRRPEGGETRRWLRGGASSFREAR